MFSLFFDWSLLSSLYLQWETSLSVLLQCHLYIANAAYLVSEASQVVFQPYSWQTVSPYCSEPWRLHKLNKETPILCRLSRSALTACDKSALWPSLLGLTHICELSLFMPRTVVFPARTDASCLLPPGRSLPWPFSITLFSPSLCLLPHSKRKCWGEGDLRLILFFSLFIIENLKQT